MNIVQNSIEAKRELRKAEKTLRNFELVSEHLNSEITQLHAQGLKSARTHVEKAQERVERVKHLVRAHIKVLKAKAALARKT
jgi:hypothetical protein